MEILDKQTTFVANSAETNAQTLADYLPGGKLFAAKNILESNLRKLLQAFSYELTRAEQKLEELVDEYYFPTTHNLIDYWEEIVGIPDECFSVEGKTIEERRKQVIAKFALMNLTTDIDFIELAAYFDTNIEILNGFDFGSFFPLVFPFFFFANEKEAKFSMVVKFLDIDRPQNTFPLTFPFTFDPPNDADFIICLFEKLKPANVKILRRYRDD